VTAKKMDQRRPMPASKADNQRRFILMSVPGSGVAAD